MTTQHVRQGVAEVPAASQTGTKAKAAIPITVVDGVEGKVCGKCKTWRPLPDFPYRNKETGRLHSECRRCKKIIARDVYLATTDETIERSRERKRQLELKHGYAPFPALAKILRETSCGDCGRAPSADVRMVFTCKPGFARSGPQGLLPRYGITEATALARAALCDAVCEDCRQARHYWAQMRATASRRGEGFPDYAAWRLQQRMDASGVLLVKRARGRSYRKLRVVRQHR